MSDGRSYDLALTHDRDTLYGAHPRTEPVDFDDTRTWKVADPLTTSAIALFGNGPWLSTAANYVSNKTYDSADKDKLPWQLTCRGMSFGKLGTGSFLDHGQDNFRVQVRQV
jgi:hypothetical protein